MAEPLRAVEYPISGTRLVPTGSVRIPVFALAMSLGMFFVITYLLCIGFDLLFPGQSMYEVWKPLLPGFTWLTWRGFLIGLLESFAYGGYVALIFGPLFNLCARIWK